MREILLKLLISNPFYGYVGASLTIKSTEKIKRIQMAASPKLNVLYNPVWFDELNPLQKEGVVVHELLHMILMHPFRIGQRNPMVWAIACDMAVNEHIDKRMLLSDSVTVNSMEKEIKECIARQRSAEYYYEILTDHDDLFAFIGNDDDETILYLDSENQLKANKFSDESMSDIDKKSLMSEISSMIDEASAEGEVPAMLGNTIDDVYEAYRVNWRKVLKRFLSGRGKTQVRRSYKRQSRRFDYLPGTKRSVGANALLAIDESGSIPDGVLDTFYKELRSINRITGATVTVTSFDTVCTEPLPLDQFIKEKSRSKNGGTDFRPIFELADRIKAPLVIIFTDGDGEVPIAVNQNTLWVLTKGGKNPAEYGYAVTMEV